MEFSWCHLHCEKSVDLAEFEVGCFRPLTLNSDGIEISERNEGERKIEGEELTM